MYWEISMESLNRKLSASSLGHQSSQVLVLGLGTVGLAVAQALVWVARFPPSSIWAVDNVPGSQFRTRSGPRS